MSQWAYLTLLKAQLPINVREKKQKIRGKSRGVIFLFIEIEGPAPIFKKCVIFIVFGGGLISHLFNISITLL
jgi:hypothetical protein